MCEHVINVQQLLSVFEQFEIFAAGGGQDNYEKEVDFIKKTSLTSQEKPGDVQVEEVQGLPELGTQIEGLMQKGYYLCRHV